MAVVNVAITDTFDVWRVRTNQIAVQSNSFENSIIDLNLRINNSPSYAYANNIGVQANAYANLVGQGANNYMITIQNGSNVAVGQGANTYANLVGGAANTNAGNATYLTIGTVPSDRVGPGSYTGITGVGTLTVGTWNAGTIPVLYGGTGGTTQSAARTNLGLGAISTQSNASVNITGGSITGITDITLADGGTGASLAGVAGGIVWSTSGTMAISAQGQPNQVLISNGSTAPSWSNQSSLQVGYATAAGSAGTAGTVTTAAQPSITSVGTLTSLAVSGAITAGGDITAFSGSDKRLKTNILKIDNALSKVNKINGITYDWTEEALKSRKTEEELFGRRRESGVIAQEIEEVLPEVVMDRDDGYKAVRYERLVPLLIEAIKELTAKVEMLESKIEK